MEAEIEQTLMTASLVADMNGYAMTAMSLYVTGVSGYLLVAYFIGPKLTLIQVAIFTGLFLMFSGFMTYGSVGFLENAHYFSQDYGRAYSKPWTGELSLITQIGGMLASVYFMWSVRHPKTE